MIAKAVPRLFPFLVGSPAGRKLVSRYALRLGPDFLRALKDENERRLRDAEARQIVDLPAYPTFVTMATTSKCNIRCEFCINQFDATPDNRFHMDGGLKQRLVSEVFPYAKRLALSVAGEPLFDPDFIDTVRTARAYGIEIEMTSNGLLLGRKGYSEAILECVRRINFSIDGGTKDTFEKVRPGANWDKLMANLTRFMGMRRDSGSPFPEVNVRYILMRQNIEELPLMVDIAADLGVNSLFTNHLQVFLPFLRDQSLLLDPELANDVFERTRARAAERGLNVVLPDPFPPEAIEQARAIAEAEAAAKAGHPTTADVDQPPAPEAVAGPQPSETESTTYRNRCPYLWDQAFLEADGNVFPCCNSNISMGQLKESPDFWSVWNGEVYRDIRSKVYTKQCYGICRHCYLREGVKIEEDREAYVRV